MHAYNYHVAFQVAVIGLYKWFYNSYNNTFTSITLRPGLLNVKRIRNDIISLEKKLSNYHYLQTYYRTHYYSIRF